MIKKFLLKLCLFLLPLLLCFAWVEYKLAHLPNTYSQKRTDFERQLSDIQILVLGPSHALHGIDPAYFSHKGYNLANASQTIYYDKEITLRYLDRLPALRLVIIPVSYNSLYTQLADSKESFRGWFYARYWGIEAPDMPKLDFRRYSNIARYTPQTAFEFAAKGFKVDLLEGLAPNGYLRYDTAGCLKNISFGAGAKRVELYRRMMKEEHLQENVAYLTQLVTTLRERNIQVCFVTAPVFKTFAKYCEPSVFENNLATLKDICLQHGCGYKNYFTDKRFTLPDFYDNDHLNFIGAAKFSAILDSEIVSRVKFN
jgi:hypothetical protein